MFALVVGLGLLPMMALILVLTIIESESLNHASKNIVPEWAKMRFESEEERSQAA